MENIFGIDNTLDEMYLSQALRNRTIHFITEFDREKCYKAIYLMERIERLDDEENLPMDKRVINIILNSYGGVCYDFLAWCSVVERLKERGYNQTSLFAREIALIIKKEYQEDNLQKVKENLAQSTLNKQEREENVKDVYKLRDIEIVKNKKILLMDDIYTTGNTLNECSKILKQAGANNVGVFTIAKD
jgi:ATP-dependent protease ClpP protease subunit